MTTPRQLLGDAWNALTVAEIDLRAANYSELAERSANLAVQVVALIERVRKAQEGER